MTPPQEVQLDSWAQRTRASQTNVSTSKTHTDQLLLSREHYHLVRDGSRAHGLLLFQEADLYGKEKNRGALKNNKKIGDPGVSYFRLFFGMVLKKKR